jgi:hypothetical protein
LVRAITDCWRSGIKKAGASLLLTPAIPTFGIVALGFLAKTEVGSIRLGPVGGGLGVYEPVPDRTVSGNRVKFVGHWGASAGKKWQECGEQSPINSHCFEVVI